MKKAFQQRLALVQEILISRPDVEIPVDELVKEVSGKLGVSLSHSQMITALRAFRESLHDPSCLRILGDATKVLFLGHKKEDEMRDSAHPKAKLEIAHVFWHFLLGKQSRNDRVTYIFPRDTQRNLQPNRFPTFEERLERLRSRYAVCLLVDSGSSTRAVVKSMLDSDSMPMKVGNAPSLSSEHPASSSVNRYILPTLITNSPRAAVDVLDHDHANKFDLRLLGGVVRGKYGSVAGELTLEALAAWGHKEKSTRYDIAVVGTTGFEDAFSGGRAFGVEHLEEATLKANLLSAALVRCVVMDSSKLDNDEVSCVFAPVSGEHIDVVFLDGGNTNERRPYERAKSTQVALLEEAKSLGISLNVMEFAKHASAHGVLPVIALGSANTRSTLPDGWIRCIT